ncbi:MAG: YHS domain-containing (seleno)protein, partial [Pseudomonadota bacterium]
MKFRALFAAVALATTPVVFAAPAAYADVAPIYTGRFSNTAVQGHDVVAYFTVGEPTKGSEDFATTYQGAEFLFASQENLDAFLADPVKYAPQYGGYCAYAVSQG